MNYIRMVLGYHEIDTRTVLDQYSVTLWSLIVNLQVEWSCFLGFSARSEGAIKGVWLIVSQIFPRHPNENPPQREDGYWRAYITRAGESTAMQVLHLAM